MEILNLGAGNKIIPGAVNHDIVQHRPEIGAVHDLNLLPWPWEDNSFDQIVARSVLEHLRPTLIETVNECWRILRPGGRLHVKVPYWNCEHAFVDPTHYWQFGLGTLQIFDPTTEYGRQYAWYTLRKWKITKGPWMNKPKTGIYAEMQVVK